MTAIDAADERLVKVTADILAKLNRLLLERAQEIERAGITAGFSENEAEAKAAAWLQRSMGFILSRVTEVAADWIAANPSSAAGHKTTGDAPDGSAEA